MFGFFMPHTFTQVLANLISLLMLLILIDVILSWVIAYSRSLSPYHPLVKAIRSIVDPILNPFRRLLPPPYKTGGWDISPMLAIIVLSILRNFLL